jgi:hypothetical protein
MTQNAETAWFVVDHDEDDRRIRGPFESSETACAVRREMERHHPHYKDEGNLWIVSERRHSDGPKQPQMPEEWVEWGRWENEQSDGSVS